MPYIPQQRRSELQDGQEPMNAGELNYLITKIVNQYCKDKSYQLFNDAIGALEGAKLELYRRVVGPYEDKKKKENGDVY